MFVGDNILRLGPKVQCRGLIHREMVQWPEHIEWATAGVKAQEVHLST